MIFNLWVSDACAHSGNTWMPDTTWGRSEAWRISVLRVNGRRRGALELDHGGANVKGGTLGEASGPETWPHRPQPQAVGWSVRLVLTGGTWCLMTPHSLLLTSHSRQDLPRNQPDTMLEAPWALLSGGTAHPAWAPPRCSLCPTHPTARSCLRFPSSQRSHLEPGSGGPLQACGSLCPVPRLPILWEAR